MENNVITLELLEREVIELKKVMEETEKSLSDLLNQFYRGANEYL